MTTIDAPVQRSRPLLDAASAPYWEAAREGRLMFPFCTVCERWFHPQHLLCPSGHDGAEFRELSGKGTVYSFTIVRERTTLGMEPPYAVAVVKLPEQEDISIIANLVELGAEQPRIGMPVEVTFETIGPDCTLPQFRPARGD